MADIAPRKANECVPGRKNGLHESGMAGRFGGGLRSASHSWPGAAMNARWLSIVAGGALLGTALAQNGSAAHRRHHLRCRLDASRRSSSLPTAAISRPTCGTL